MKNIICVFIALFCLTNSFSQDQLKDYPGIPIITYRGCVISNSVGGPYLTVDDFKYADSSGIFAMQLDNVNANEFNTYIAPTNLRVMPAEIDKTLTDYILTYTEGRYTEFEAEGTPWEDGVTLYSDSLDLYFGNGAVSTKPTTEHGTMIYGPMYRQCRNYLAVTPGPIPYTASYIIKIDDVDPWLDSSPEDTVCILQVTSSRTWDTCGYMIGTDWVQSQFYTGFEETLVHADTVITYGDLQPSIWDTVHLNYIFDHNVPWFGPASNPYQVVSRYGSNNENMLDEHISQNCVEFKVIWKGKADRVKLSIDKIIVSDLRGRNLKNTNQFQDIKENIEQQIRDLLAFTSVEDESRTVGFIGVDEPWSLDQWEPIRIVNEIINNYQHNERSLAASNEHKESQVTNQKDN